VEGETFNLGTGAEISIGDLAQKVIQRLGKPVAISTDPERLRPPKSEVMRLVSDNALARVRLSWQPTITLDEGLDRTIAWIAANLAAYQPDRYQF
jgi:nucleoside-diphosphate-sugar epimerase